ncbi:MAG: hypothetical protein ACE1ZW_06555, partial [Nitrospirales bacterium]
MSIQWFPGHMNTARREVAKTIASIDVIVEVLDARIPEASSNPMITELRRGQKTRLDGGPQVVLEVNAGRGHVADLLVQFPP